jgi:hypothetical protein
MIDEKNIYMKGRPHETLSIHKLRCPDTTGEDRGEYECQANTEPKGEWNVVLEVVDTRYILLKLSL